MGVANDVGVERGRFRSDCETELGGRNSVVGFSGLVGDDGSNTIDIGGLMLGINEKLGEVDVVVKYSQGVAVALAYNEYADRGFFPFLINLIILFLLWRKRRSICI